MAIKNVSSSNVHNFPQKATGLMDPLDVIWQVPNNFEVMHCCFASIFQEDNVSKSIVFVELDCAILTGELFESNEFVLSCKNEEPQYIDFVQTNILPIIPCI